MYKKYSSVIRTKCPITMYKITKNENFENFEPLIGHGPHWINVTIFTLISEKNRYFKCPYKIWRKFNSFDILKKENLKQVIGFIKKKMNLGPKSESLCFKYDTLIILGP